MLKVWLELARVSNLPTVWSNVLAAWLLSGGKPGSALWLMLLGGSLIYTGGMVLNDAADAKWDKVNKPERPVPAGRVSLRVVWVVGLAAMMTGALLCMFAKPGERAWVLALVAAVLAYDLFHKPWAGSVVVMGACRTFLYLATGGLTVLWPGVALGIYIVAVSLIARAEGKMAVGALQRLALVALLLSPLWLAVQVPGIWLVPAAVFLVLVMWALKLMRRGGPAIGHAVGWLLAGIPLVDALALSAAATHWPWVASLCLLPPLLRYWQRFVSAT
jgi:hypothetical protein